MMKKQFKKILIVSLCIVLFLTGMPMNILAFEKEEKYPYALFAGNNILCAGGVLNINGNIHANQLITYQCVNGAVNGESSSKIVNYDLNCHVNARNELTGQDNQPMIYINDVLMNKYFGKDSYVQQFVENSNNINIVENIYSETEISIGGNINMNNAAVGAIRNISIGTEKNTHTYNVNANQSILYSALGDINLEADNFNYNGFIYAPNGDVTITSKGNLGINGIVIARNIYLQGTNINLQQDDTMARFVVEAMGKTDDDTVDVPGEGNEDTTEKPTEDANEKENIDTDGDGLFDSIETYIGTDLEKEDSDDDSLTDYEEIYLVGTDPLKKDTDGDGIEDSLEDDDTDGINVLKELELGTSPMNEDSDYDGLLDGEEIEYLTEPLDADTDDDNLMDGDEIILGLEPYNTNTFEVHDSKYIMQQKIIGTSQILEQVNVPTNAYELQIDAKVSGNLERYLIVKETDYKAAINEQYVVGMPIELSYNEIYDTEEVILNFYIKDDYRNNDINYFSDENDTENYSPELVGIKRLQVFKYFEDDNMLLPVETTHNLETNSVSAVVDEFGIYCLFDMESMLLDVSVLSKEESSVMSIDDYEEEKVFSEEESRGGCPEQEAEIEAEDDKADEEDAEEIEIEGDKTDEEDVVEIEAEDDKTDEEDIEEIEAEDGKTDEETIEEIETKDDKSAEENGEKETEIEEGIISENVMTCNSDKELDKDIVFVLQTVGTNADAYKQQVEVIKAVAENAFSSNDDVRICVISQEYDSAVFLGKKEWYTNANDLCQALDAEFYIKLNKYCNRSESFKLILEKVDFRDNAIKYVYFAMNGYTNVKTNDISQLTLCKKLDVIYSEVRPARHEYSEQSYEEKVNEAIFKSGGEVFIVNDSCAENIINHINNEAHFEIIGFYTITANGWEFVELDDVLDAENGVDTDTDSLADWDEVDINHELITWNADGSIELPTIHQCMMHNKPAYVENGLDRLLAAEGVPSDAASGLVAMMIYNYKMMPINSNPNSIDSDEDGLTDERDEKPLHYDYIPDKFLQYVKNGYIETSDLRRAEDGFTICTKPLGDIMDAMQIEAEGYKTIGIPDENGDKIQYETYNGMKANEYYFSDWYIYGFVNEREEPIYSIIKRRTVENNMNTAPGVSVPFREFNISLMDEEYDEDKLGAEIEKITVMDDIVTEDESVRKYFANPHNKTNYFLADIYIEIIIKNDNIESRNVFEAPYGVLPRVTELLESNPDIYDKESNTIVIDDINHLSLEEKQCLLVSRAGTISYNAWAGEIIAHAQGTKLLPEAWLVDDIFGYENAKKADLGSLEGGTWKEKIFESFFAYEDSWYTSEQRRIFGDF